MNTTDLQRKNMKYNSKLVNALLANDETKMDVYNKKLEMYNAIGEQAGGQTGGMSKAELQQALAATRGSINQMEDVGEALKEIFDIIIEKVTSFEDAATAVAQSKADLATKIRNLKVPLTQ